MEKFDYSSNGCYHITICAKDKQFVFGNIKATKDGATVELSEIGKIAENNILEINKHYISANVVLYVIMPNHIHILLCISNCDRNGRQVAAPTVNTIIGQYKRTVSIQIGYSIWQKGFYDHIIRNYNDFNETIEYINNNPMKWFLQSE